MQRHSARLPLKQMHAVAVLNLIAAPFKLLQDSVETLAINRTVCRMILLCLVWLNPPRVGSSYMADAGGG